MNTTNDTVADGGPMTQPAGAARPAPSMQPQPAGQGQRRADDTADAGKPTEPATADGFSLWMWLGDLAHRYWSPPALWAEPAASLHDLSTYAHHGGWTTAGGFLRACGIGWWRLVGLPVTATCRRLEWIAQRPGRFVTVFVLFELLAHTSYGHVALTWLATALHWLAWLLT